MGNSQKLPIAIVVTFKMWTAASFGFFILTQLFYFVVGFGFEGLWDSFRFIFRFYLFFIIFMTLSYRCALKNFVEETSYKGHKPLYSKEFDDFLILDAQRNSIATIPISITQGYLSFLLAGVIIAILIFLGV